MLFFLLTPQGSIKINENDKENELNDDEASSFTTNAHLNFLKRHLDAIMLTLTNGPFGRQLVNLQIGEFIGKDTIACSDCLLNSEVKLIIKKMLQLKAVIDGVH